MRHLLLCASVLTSMSVSAGSNLVFAHDFEVLIELRNSSELFLRRRVYVKHLISGAQVSALSATTEVSNNCGIHADTYNWLAQIGEDSCSEIPWNFILESDAPSDVYMFYVDGTQSVVISRWRDPYTGSGSGLGVPDVTWSHDGVRWTSAPPAPRSEGAVRHIDPASIQTYEATIPAYTSGSVVINGTTYSVDDSIMTEELGFDSTVFGSSTPFARDVTIAGHLNGPKITVYAYDPAEVQLSASPYYSGGYRVGLSATWGAVPGAASYRVTHCRNDFDGDVCSIRVWPSSQLSSGSGRHTNSWGHQGMCYFRSVVVEALDSSGIVMRRGERAGCWVGYQTVPANPDLSPALAPMLIESLPFFWSGYRVGLNAKAGPVAGMTTHHYESCSKEDGVNVTCVDVFSDSRNSNSPAYLNPGAPSSCLEIRRRIVALDGSGNRLATAYARECQVGHP